MMAAYHIPLISKKRLDQATYCSRNHKIAVTAVAGFAQKIEIFFQGLFKDFSRTKIIFQGPFMECHVTRLAK